jgi:hypothetical protein
MVLQRRDKKRYLLILLNDRFFPENLPHNRSGDVYLYDSNSKVSDVKNQVNNKADKIISSDFLNPKKKNKFNSHNFHLNFIIKQRFQEIFGSIELEKSNIYLIHKQPVHFKNCVILRCNLKSIDKILFTLSCCNPPLTTIKISGTIRRLIAQSENKL